MNRPQIQTAIPKRRYQLGDFSVVVLGEITSDEAIDYRYVMAMVQEGQSEPCLYVTASKVAPDDYLLRLIAPSMDRELDISPLWRDLDAFCEQALSLAQQAMGLKDEYPHRMM